MPLRIQIIEDESDFSEPLAEMLRAEGYTVRIFASLAEAQDTAWLATTDLVILDRAFPDGDGLSLLPGIRQSSNLPVIILTGAGAIEERIRGLDADADYYLVKPVDVDELFAVIRRYDRKQSGIADVVDQKAIWHLDAATWSLTIRRTSPRRSRSRTLSKNREGAPPSPASTSPTSIRCRARSKV